MIVTEGAVKEHVQDICTHLARIDSTGEVKRSYLVQGLGDEQFCQVCRTTYGCKGADATVASLAKHILALDALADLVRSGKSSHSGRGVWLCRAKLRARGLTWVPKVAFRNSNERPSLLMLERQQLIKDTKCSVCCEVGHNQNGAQRCTRHLDHAKATGKGVALCWSTSIAATSRKVSAGLLPWQPPAEKVFCWSTSITATPLPVALA